MVRDLAYFIQGDAGPGPGVLVLHSFWGLTPSVKSLAGELADRGFTVLAPDINFGELPASEHDALDHLGKADPNRLASLVLSSAQLLNEKSTEGPIGMVGFGMGGSLALWASVRLPEVVGAVVSFYGSQQIDFAGAGASYLINLAEDDEFITDDEAAFMEATMRLEDLDVQVVRHPGTRHGFGEPDGDTFDPGAFDSSWGRSVEFLEKQLNT
ncbi:MAG: dienelactone hydrolase family protein [Actinomycetota bacterium]|nr:dienelactone hydrolase family protein [Actinomycetota bacterium]